MSLAAVEILEIGEKSLDELAAVANREHQETCEALVASLAHAIRCGEALLEAYERIGPADWTVWAAANLKMSPVTISKYKRIAYYKDLLPPAIWQTLPHPNNGTEMLPSLNRALVYVRGLPPVTPKGRRGFSEETKREAKRLRQKGLSYRRIGELLGMSLHTARYVCDTSANARMRRAANLRNKRQRAAMSALQQQEERRARDRAAKTAGGSREETYTLIRNAAQKAQAALDEATTADARTWLNEAIAHLHRAEDALVAALRAQDAL